MNPRLYRNVAADLGTLALLSGVGVVISLWELVAGGSKAVWIEEGDTMSSWWSPPMAGFVASLVLLLVSVAEIWRNRRPRHHSAPPSVKTAANNPAAANSATALVLQINDHSRGVAGRKRWEP